MTFPQPLSHRAIPGETETSSPRLELPTGRRVSEIVITAWSHQVRDGLLRRKAERTALVRESGLNRMDPPRRAAGPLPAIMHQGPSPLLLLLGLLLVIWNISLCVNWPSGLPLCKPSVHVSSPLSDQVAVFLLVLQP